MKRRISLFILSVCLLAALLPVTALAADDGKADFTGYYGVVNDAFDEVGFNSLKEYGKDCNRGLLWDLDGDGTKELLLNTYNGKNYAPNGFQLWTIHEGKPALLLEENEYSHSHHTYYLAEYQGEDFLVVSYGTGGTMAITIYYHFYKIGDTSDGNYKEIFYAQHTHYTGGGDECYINNVEANKEAFDKLADAVENGTELKVEAEGTRLDDILDSAPDLGVGDLWFQQYGAYIKKHYESAESQNYWNYVEYYLLYIDEDDIPELWIVGQGAPFENILLSCQDGELVELVVDASHVVYEERSGVFCLPLHRMGWGQDVVYKLSDGKITQLAKGTEEAKVDGKGQMIVGSDGFVVLNYFWDGASISKADYQAKLAQYVDPDKAIESYPDVDAYDYWGLGQMFAHMADELDYELTITADKGEVEYGKTVTFTCSLTCEGEAVKNWDPPEPSELGRESDGDLKFDRWVKSGSDWTIKADAIIAGPVTVSMDHDATAMHTDMSLNITPKVPDTWKFINSNDELGPVSAGYYITDTDYLTLLNSLSASDMAAVLFDDLYNKDGKLICKDASRLNLNGELWEDHYHPWNGSCYGMTASMFLANNEALDPEFIGGKSSLYAYSATKAVKSVIHFYHVQQFTDKSLSHENSFSGYSQESQLQILENYGKVANITSEPFLISYQWEKPVTDENGKPTTEIVGHTVLGYGWTQLEEPVEYDGHSFDKMIYIYDCAASTQNRHIYYNDANVFFINEKGIISTDNTIGNEHNNGHLLEVTKDTSLIGVVDYEGNTDPEIESIASLTTSGDLHYFLNWGEQRADIEGLHVQVEGSDETLFISAEKNATADGNYRTPNTTLVLPEASEYTVSTGEDNLSFGYHDGAYFVSVGAEAPGSVTFHDNGNAQLTTVSPADYYLRLVADKETESMPWESITISGSEGTEINAVKKGGTVVITGNGLKDAIITVAAGADSKTVTILPETETVEISSEAGAPMVREDADGDGTFEQDVVTVREEPERPDVPEEPAVIRLAGDNRFETANLVADRMKKNLGIEKFDAVVVASGTDFADALAGSYLAAVKKAPILLAYTTDTINDGVKDYIKANLNQGGTVYILGGTKAVPESFKDGLEDSFTVKRLAGGNRFETNLLVLEEAGVGDKPILVATGLTFADSLSASAAKLPILLVYGDKPLPEQEAFLNAHPGRELYVIGGEGAVNGRMEEALKGFGTVERVAGGNRFETSVLIAEKFFENPESAVLAYAWDFPDGLCGGPLATTMNAPLILTMAKYEAKAAEYVQSKGIAGAVILGGEKLIPQTSINTIFPRDTLHENELPIG